MKDNLSGNIPSYDRTLFNEEQSLIIYPDFADVDTGSFLSAEFWIFDMNTGERRTLGIFNKVAFWTFADNDTLVVLHEKTLKDQTCETVLERIDIKNKDSKEILLNEKELIRILGKDSDGNPPIYRPTWTYFFEEDETKSFLMFDGKIRIVDYEKKRLVTTSNRLYADFPEGLPEDGDWEYICGCNLWRSDTSFTLLAYTAVPEYDKISQTLGQFHYEITDEGTIVIAENAYEGEPPVFAYIFISLACAGILIEFRTVCKETDEKKRAKTSKKSDA